MGETRRTRVTYLLEAPTWGGAEAYVLTLVDALRDQVDATVLAVDPVPDRLLADAVGRVEVLTVPRVRGKLDVRAVVATVRAVRRTRPDLVHVNLNAPANNRYGVLAAALAGAPSVGTLHLTLPLRSRLQVLALRRSFGLLDRVVVVAEPGREQLLRQLRVAPERVLLVPNGVPVRAPAGRSRAPGAPLVVGCVARLVRQKGVDVLVEATRQLVADHVPVQVRVAGAGPELDELRSQAAGLPVELVGEVRDVPAWLDGLDVFCLPSRDEGLPLALLEAMMAGLPCLATDVGQVSQALGAGVVVVAPERPAELARVLAGWCGDPSARAAQGRRGRELVLEHHSAQSMAAATWAVYQEVSEVSTRQDRWWRRRRGTRR